MSVLTRRKEAADATQQVAAPPAFRLPQVNLLPPEIYERRAKKRAAYGAGAIVLAAVAVAGGLTVMANGAVADAQSELDTELAQQTQLQAQVAEYSSVTAVYSQVEAGEAMLETAMGTEVQWSRYLNDLSLSIPQNVWLTNVDATQADATAAAPADGSAVLADPGRGTVTFTGKALEHDDVAVWLEALAQQVGYTNPYFSSSAEELIGTKPVVTFTSTATLTDDAFSGRYLRSPGEGN